MTLDIIGAGLGRTGTMTLKRALETLGYDRCYHMTEFMAHPEHLKYWRALHEREPTDLDALFDGYRATVDYPGATLYRQLVDYYPDAKVILTIRDADDWYESTLKTIYSAKPTGLEMVNMLVRMPFSRRLRGMAGLMRLVTEMNWSDLFQDRFEDRSFAIETFHRHNREVRELVPEERLLVYEVTQGWAPLCQFLDRPVPEQPFPHVNKRADFAAKRKKILRGEAPDIE